jgi:hypothetical protein
VTFGGRAGAALIVAWTGLAALGCAAGGGSVNLSAGGSPSYSRQLLRRECYGCHRPPRPEEWSGRAWRDWLDRMKRRVKLAPADWDSLVSLVRPDTAIAAPSR